MTSAMEEWQNNNKPPNQTNLGHFKTKVLSNFPVRSFVCQRSKNILPTERKKTKKSKERKSKSSPVFFVAFFVIDFSFSLTPLNVEFERGDGSCSYSFSVPLYSPLIRFICRLFIYFGRNLAFKTAVRFMIYIYLLFAWFIPSNYKWVAISTCLCLTAFTSTCLRNNFPTQFPACFRYDSSLLVRY